MIKKLLLILLLNFLLAAGLGALIYQAFLSTRQGTSRVEPGPLLTQKEERLVEEFLRSEDASHSRKPYEALFLKANQDRLERLQSHPNDDIAMRAAWEEVRRTAGMGASGPFGPNPTKLLRFQKFVESRLRIAMPEWWADLCAQSTGDNSLSLSPCTWKSEHSGATVEDRGELLLLQTGAQSVTFPGAYLKAEQPQRPLYSVSVGVGPQHYYVALLDQWSGGCPLVCIEPDSGKIVWKARVRGADASRGWRVMWWFTVVADGERVIVLACDDWRVFIEAFDVKEGSNLFRFNTRTEFRELDN